MIKRVLVIIDNSKSSLEAQKYAISLSKKIKCELTGLAILNTPRITAVQTEPLSGSAYKIHKDDEIIRKSHKQVKNVLNKFKKTYQLNNLQGNIIKIEGFPTSEIELLSQEHDLILIGQKTDFHSKFENDSDKIIKYIVRNNPRPILSIPNNQNLATSNDIAIAYDGSIQSARALHIFLLLGLGKDSILHILTIGKYKSEAYDIAMRAVRMCKSYNIQANPIGITSHENKAKVILKTIQNLPVNLLVIGLFNNHIISEVLFGSCATTLIEKSKIPLFIYH